MSVLGAVSIEVSLNMSGVDNQLKALESKKLKPIKQSISLDAAAFKKEIKALVVDPIKVDLSPNVEDFQEKLKRIGKLSDVKIGLTADVDGFRENIRGLKIDPIKVDLSPNVEDFQEKLRRVAKISPVKVQVEVDKTLVVNNFQELGKYAAEGFVQGFGDGVGGTIASSIVEGVKRELKIQSPSRVFKDLGRYSKEGYLQDLAPSGAEIRNIVKGIENEFKNAKLTLDLDVNSSSTSLRHKSIGSDNSSINKALSRFSNNLPGAIEEGFKNANSKGLASLLFSGVKGVAGGLIGGLLLPLKIAGIGFSTVIAGSLMKVGEDLTANVSQGLTSSIENSLSSIIGSGNIIGEVIGEEIVETIGNLLGGQAQQLKPVIREVLGKERVVTASLSRKAQNQSKYESEKLEAAKIAQEEFRSVGEKGYVGRIKKLRSEVDQALPQLQQDIAGFQATYNKEKQRLEKIAEEISIELDPQKVVDLRVKNYEKQVAFYTKIKENLEAEGRISDASKLDTLIQALPKPDTNVSNVSENEVQLMSSLETEKARQSFISNRLSKFEPEKQALQQRKQEISPAIQELQQLENIVANVVENLEALGVNVASKSEIPFFYNKIVQEVAKESGVEIKKEQIPTLTSSDKLETAGLYTPELNQITVRSDIIEKLQSGNILDIDDQDILTLVHELRHAIQFAFGDIDVFAGEAPKIELLELTPEEANSKIALGVQGSTSIHANATDQVAAKAIETDAYAFEYRKGPEIAGKIKSQALETQFSQKYGIGGLTTQRDIIDPAIKQATSSIKEILPKLQEMGIDPTPYIEELIQGKTAALEEYSNLKQEFRQLDLSGLSFEELKTAIDIFESTVSNIVYNIEQIPNSAKELITEIESAFNTEPESLPTKLSIGQDVSQEQMESVRNLIAKNISTDEEKQQLVGNITNKGDAEKQRLDNAFKDAIREIFLIQESVRDLGIDIEPSVVGATKEVKNLKESLDPVFSQINNAEYLSTQELESLSKNLSELVQNVVDQIQEIPFSIEQESVNLISNGQQKIDAWDLSESEFIKSLNKDLYVPVPETDQIKGDKTENLDDEIAKLRRRNELEKAAINESIPSKITLDDTNTRYENDALSIITRLVAQASGVNVSPEQIPSLKSLTQEQVESGGLGYYSAKENKIALPEKAIEQLKLGYLSKEIIETLIHELRHAVQSNFGEIQGLDSVIPLVSATPEEELKHAANILASLEAAFGGADVSPIAESQLIALEEDAYVFTERFFDAIFKGLEQELSKHQESFKSIYVKLAKQFHPDLAKSEEEKARNQKIMQEVTEAYKEQDPAKLIQIRDKYSNLSAEESKGINSTSTKEEVDKIKGSSQENTRNFLLNNSDQSKDFLAKNINSEGIKQLATSLGVDTKNANKEYLINEISRFAATSENRKDLETAINNLSQDKFLKNSNFKPETEPVQGNFSDFINDVKELRKSLKIALQESLDLAIDEKAQSLQKIVAVIEEVQESIKELRRSAVISPEESKSLGGTRASLNNLAYQAKEQMYLAQNEISVKESETLGQQLHEGFIQGLENSYPSVLKTVEQQFQGVIQSVRNVLDIQSPSGEGEEIGNFFGIGFEKGFANTMKKVSGKVASIMTEIIQATKNIFDDISFEKNTEEASKIQPTDDKPKTLKNKAQEFIQDPVGSIQKRSHNAVITKARYMTENAESLVSIVGTKIGDDPADVVKLIRLQEAFSTLGEAAASFGENESEENFQALDSAVKELESSLRGAGVHFEFINKYIDEFKSNLEKMQSEGKIDLDVNIEELTPQKLGLVDNLLAKISKLQTDGLDLIKETITGIGSLLTISFLQDFFSNLAQEAFNAYIELDKIKTALNFASGSTSAGTQNLKFVKRQVEELRIPLNAAIEGFTGLQASLRGTSIESQSKEIFKGISQAGTVLSLDEETMGGTYTALSQIASKGKAQAEELRGQLGDRIPGALNIAARSMSMTTAEFGKMLDSGQILSEDFLPRFAKQLQTEFGEAAADAAGNAQSAIYNLQNSVLEFQQGVGEGVAPAAVVGIEILASLMKTATAISGELGIALIAISATLSVKMAMALKEVIANLIATKLATGTLGGGIASLANTINNSFSAKLTVGIFGVLEVVKLLNSAINTELVQSFEKAAKSAKRAAEEAQKDLKPQKSQLNSGGNPESSSGVGRVADIAIRPMAAIYNASLGKITGRKMQTWGEYEQNAVNEDISNMIGGAADIISAGKMQVSKLISGELSKVEQELQKLEALRAIVQADNERSFTSKGLIVPPQEEERLAKVNEQISELNKKRQELTKDPSTTLSTVEKQISSFQAQIQALESEDAIKAVGGEAAAERLRESLRASIKALKQFKTEAEMVLGGMKINPILAFEQAFKKLNSTLLESQEKAEDLFLKRQKNIADQELIGFKNNKFASQNSPVQEARNEINKSESNLAALQKAVTEGQKALNIPGFEATLQRLGISAESSMTKIDSVLESLEDDADKEIVEKIKTLKEQQNQLLEAETSLSQSLLALKQAEQDRILTRIDEASESSRNRFDREQNEALAFFKRGEAKGSISAEDVEQYSAEVELRKTQQLKKEVFDRIYILRYYHASGKISAEEYHQRIKELHQEESDLIRQEAEAELALGEATNAKKLADLENYLNKAQQLLDKNRTEATARNKQRFLDEGMTPVAEARMNQFELIDDRKQTEGKISAAYEELNQYQNLYNQGVIDLKQFNEKKLELNQELASLNIELIDQQIQDEENYRKSVEAGINEQMDLEKAHFDLLNSQLSTLKNAQELYTESLDRTLKLEESRFNLTKASSDADISFTEMGRDRVNRSLDLARRLKDEELDPRLRSEIVEQLQANGFQNLPLQSADKDSLLKIELGILDTRNQIESEIAAKKLESLQREHEFQRESLRIDLERQRIASETAILDAEGLQLAAQKTKLEQEGALRLAQFKKDDIAIEAAQIGLEIAQKEAEIADKKLESSLENLRIQEELSKNAKLTQEYSQKSALDQQIASESARKQAASLERVETAVGKISTKSQSPEAKLDNNSNNSKPSESSPSGWKNPLQRWTLKEHEEWKRSRQKSGLRGERMESDFQMKNRISEMRGLGQIVKLPDVKVSSIDYSGFDFGQGMGTISTGFTQSPNGSLYRDEMMRNSRNAPNFNNKFNPGISEAPKDGLQSSVNQIDQKLQTLISSISAVASRPTTLQVSSPQPVQDAAKIYSEMSKNAVKSAGL